MTGDPHPPNTMLKAVACIPAFNEERTIGVVVRALRVVVCNGGYIVGWLIHDPYVVAFFSAG